MEGYAEEEFYRELIGEVFAFLAREHVCERELCRRIGKSPSYPGRLAERGRIGTVELREVLGARECVMRGGRIHCKSRIMSLMGMVKALPPGHTGIYRAKSGSMPLSWVVNTVLGDLERREVCEACGIRREQLSRFVQGKRDLPAHKTALVMAYVRENCTGKRYQAASNALHDWLFRVKDSPIAPDR